MFMSNEPEVQKEFYDNGKLKKETHYKNGKQDGLETTWYESGKKKSEKHYEVGIEKSGKDVGTFPPSHYHNPVTPRSRVLLISP